MIESRYKIEYVLPDEDVKKTSSFRVLWYLLLIPLILMAVTAITYDFSWSNISRDSLVLVEKAKVHIFNLGEVRKPNKVETKINTVVETSSTPKASAAQKIIKQVIKEPATASIPATIKPIIKKNKIIISELTAKQELQLKTIKAQIAENTELTQKLDNLSEKLVLEQIKNQELNYQLAEEEKDRTELEEQLNQILEDSADTNVSSEKIITYDQNTGTVTLESKTILSEEPVKIKPIEVVQDIAEDNSKKLVKAEETGQTETDKIIETMITIASDKDKSVEAEVEKVVEVEKTAKPNIHTNNEESSSENAITDNKEPEENEDLSSIPKPIVAIKEAETTTVNKEEIEIKTETSLNPEPEQKADTNIQVPKKNSAVDDIIAAMQNSQPNSTSSKQEKKPTIESKLATEEKQQLVEKEELSSDSQ